MLESRFVNSGLVNICCVTCGPCMCNGKKLTLRNDVRRRGRELSKVLEMDWEGEGSMDAKVNIECIRWDLNPRMRTQCNSSAPPWTARAQMLSRYWWNLTTHCDTYTCCNCISSNHQSTTSSTFSFFHSHPHLSLNHYHQTLIEIRLYFVILNFFINIIIIKLTISNLIHFSKGTDIHSFVLMTLMHYLEIKILIIKYLYQ